MSKERPDFLSKKYPDLPGSRPVERATGKANRDPKREFSAHTRDERIQAYLDRLENVVQDERGWEHLKYKIVQDLTLDIEDPETLSRVATALYDSERRIAVERGQGQAIPSFEDNPELELQFKDLVIDKRAIQADSLSSWLEYLRQNDAQYPMWFGYYVIRSLAKMGQLDKEKGEYGKRGNTSVAPFPELNSEALGFVYRMLTTGIGDKEYADDEEKEKRTSLANFIEKKDFARLYAFAQIETAGALNRESLEGEWVVYPQGTDPYILEEALRGKGTGWCTAEGSAPSQLAHGDFHVYYTRGIHGTYSEPRVAIRMENGEIAEVRGVNHRQELEPALLEKASARYHALPGGERFDKKSADMKHVTLLAQEQEKGISFTKEDLIFLYEIDSSIEGFGYDKDPRIEDLRRGRDTEADMFMMFDCAPEDIAHTVSEITEQTKAYVGTLEKGIFDVLPAQVEHIYTSFPHERIRLRKVELGTHAKSGKEYIEKLKEKNMCLWGEAEYMLQSKECKILSQGAIEDLVEVSVESLGFPRGARYDEICARAQELGLELAPSEVGPALRLEYTDQPVWDWFRIAMKPISDADGNPRLFSLGSNDDGLNLYVVGGYASDHWDAGYRFVFSRRRKVLSTSDT